MCLLTPRSSRSKATGGYSGIRASPSSAFYQFVAGSHSSRFVSIDPVPPPRIPPIPAPTPRRRLPVVAGLRISAVSRSGAADHLDFLRRLGLVGIQRVIVGISRLSDYLFVVFGFCDSVDPRLANEVGNVESALRHLVAGIVPRNSPSRCFDLRWIHHGASKAIGSDSVHP